MRRREFFTLIGGAASWPIAARAQQAEHMRRIGVLMLYPENDPEGQLRATAFRQGLQKLGWVVGRNVQIDFQWGLGDADWMKSAAAQFQRLAFLKMSQFRGNTRQIGGNDVNLQGRSARRVADLACDC